MRVAVRGGTDDETGKLEALIAELKEKGIELPVWSKEWDLARTVEAIRGLVEGRVGNDPERRG